MYQQRIKSLKIANFGPFMGEHVINLPENGLVLVRGKVVETGDSSGAGKSLLLNSIPYVLGGCQFSANQLQNWNTEDPPEVQLVLSTHKGDAFLTRKKGLSLKADFLKETYKGKAADPELDKIFDMDAKTRAQVTYRPQKKPGLFLSMEDKEKKSFLSKLLDLEKYEKVSILAQKAIGGLEGEVMHAINAFNLAAGFFEGAQRRLEEVKVSEQEESELLQQKIAIDAIIAAAQKAGELHKKEIKAQTLLSSQALEAVLETVRKKVAQINSRGLPVEVEAIRKEISNIQQTISELKQQDLVLKQTVQRQRSEIEQEIREIKSKYEKLHAEKAGLVKTKLAEIDGKINLYKNSANQLEILKTRHEKLLKSLCPTCGQMWGNTKAEIESVLKQIDAEKANLADLEVQKTNRTTLQNMWESFKIKQAEALNQELAQKQQQLASLKDPETNPDIQIKNNEVQLLTSKAKSLEDSARLQKQRDLEALFQEEKQIKAEFAARLQEIVGELENKVGNIAIEINNRCNELTNVNTKLQVIERQKVLLKERQEELSRCEESLKKAKAEKEALEAKLFLEQDIVALVGYKGFLGAIFDDVLGEISAQTNDILSKVANVRHLTLDFESEKEAATSGNIVARITPVIYNRGRKVTFEAGISGGMQTAVELAVDLAVGNVVSYRRNTYPNFLILDESLHGLGGVAKETCMDMLADVAGDRLVLVVDHNNEFGNLFSQVITVEQENGISRVL